MRNARIANAVAPHATRRVRRRARPATAATSSPSTRRLRRCTIAAKRHVRRRRGERRSSPRPACRLLRDRSGNCPTATTHRGLPKNEQRRDIAVRDDVADRPQHDRPLKRMARDPHADRRPGPPPSPSPSWPTAVGLRVMKPPNRNTKAIGISTNATPRSAGVGVHRKSACDSAVVRTMIRKTERRHRQQRIDAEIGAIADRCAPARRAVACC